MSLDPQNLIRIIPAEGISYLRDHPPREDGFFMSRAVIFVNGRIPSIEAARTLLQPGDTLIAADGGSRHVLALGLLPSVVIGDLDSISTATRRTLERSGVRLLEYPRDKNETDFELALQYAVAAGHDPTLVVGALGNRLDQTLGNLALLSNPPLSGLNIRLDDGLEEVFFVRSRCELHGAEGEVVSLIPWGGPVTGIVTGGLRWPLLRETLQPGRTRGISNEMLGESGTISLESGLLLVVHSRHTNN
jgi:thiamine pyrophosphokinase